MFTKLNQLLLEDFIAFRGKVSQSDKELFVKHLEYVEESYKRRMLSSRRGNGVVSRVDELCTKCGHNEIAVIPYMNCSQSGLYRVIALNKSNKTYSVFTYNSALNSLNVGIRGYGNSLKSACILVGLKF